MDEEVRGVWVMTSKVKEKFEGKVRLGLMLKNL